MEQDHTFDVVIMGGGIGGNFQARHLMLNIPGIKVAIVEPRSAEQVAKISKIGESTVEIAGMFMVKELGLGAYLTEKHMPKNGLNFHWPKEGGRSDSMDDYYSMWALKQPPVHAWQIHRGTLESDLMAMNAEMGATIYEGRVRDFEVTSGDQPNTVTIKVKGADKLTLTCKHLIDAAGRSFLTGRKFDNILKEPEHRFGTHTGASWVRIKNADRTLFHDEYDPRQTGTVRYYGTNHFFGPGHWLWMIPLSRENRELSIGMMHHHEVIPASDVNSRDKLLAFLEANHSVLHKLITEADEVDFQYWASPAHTCKQVFSKDNWSGLGDAIYFGDAFYSVGISATVVTVECTTELIRAARAGEPDLAEKREAYDKYIKWFCQTNAHTYRDHSKVLGNASMMSWRIYFEYIWWFGALVPTFIGKWHLQVPYIKEQLANCPRHSHNDVYKELNELAEQGVNVGFMDAYRADQLPFGYYPDKHHLHYLENTSYGPRDLNVYTSVAATHFYALLWWIKLQARAHGVQAVKRPRAWKVAGYLAAQTVKIKFRAWWHDLELLFKRKTDPHHVMQREFKGYQAPGKPQPFVLPEPARKAG